MIKIKLKLKCYDFVNMKCPHCSKLMRVDCDREEYHCAHCHTNIDIPYRELKYICSKKDHTHGKKAKKSASRKNKRRSSTSRKRKSSKGKRV
jgi:hypothetical protein